MTVDVESRAVQGLTGFLGMVALNLLFLLCCLPVVTAGAAMAALFALMSKYSDDEQGNPVRDFLPALRVHGRRASAVAAALGLPAVGLAFAALFWFSTPTAVGACLGAVAALACLYLLAALLFALALVSHTSDGVRLTMRNALLLPGAEPLRTALLLLVPATLVSLTVVLPAVVMLWATIGFSASAYLYAFVFRSVFRRHA